jgi:NAD(P)-dependent dehydrogenase (short-subunit alcohol dehydrogenase family)
MKRGAPERPRTIITGATGGMGRACARLLGATTDLVLTDVSPALGEFAAQLESEGYVVAAAVGGDQCDPAVLRRVAEEAGRGFSALVHTAGLPPSADWRRIVEVNYTATVRLLDAV